MTILDLRSDLAMEQARLTILAENARTLEETRIGGLIENAFENLAQAFALTEHCLPNGDRTSTAWFGREIEAPVAHS